MMLYKHGNSFRVFVRLLLPGGRTNSVICETQFWSNQRIQHFMLWIRLLLWDCLFSQYCGLGRNEPGINDAGLVIQTSRFE